MRTEPPAAFDRLHGLAQAGVLQTLVIAGGLLFMRSESRARAQEHARRHEETMTALKEERDARQA